MKIADLKPYAAMKNSGMSWLGGIPASWSVVRNGRLFVERKETGFADLPILEVSLRSGVRVRRFDDDARKQIMSDRDKYKRARAGDLAYNMMRMWQGAVGLPPVDGLVSPAYVVARPLSGVVARYFAYLFRTDSYMGEVDQYSRGIVKDRNRLYWDQFKQMPSACPPAEEQAAIVRFLSHADRQIRRYIRAKQRVINLLEEQKQATIQRAVTRGLDSNVRSKPSGVEWLGDVPEHWKVTRLKFIATRIVDCLHATPVYSEHGEYPAIRTADVQPGWLRLDCARRVDKVQYLRWTARMEPAEGDILYTREGERFGIAALVPAAVRLCISQRMTAFRIQPTQNSAYVMWQINCQHAYAQAAGGLIGAAAPHVNVERIKNLWMVLPPRREQDEIVAAVKALHSGPNETIARAHKEIALLSEYRTCLVADVVTGKLDVREAAATLPDEAGEPEPLDDTAAVDTNEPTDDADLDTTGEEDEA